MAAKSSLKSQELLGRVDRYVSDGMSVGEACKKLEIPRPTYYRWRREAISKNPNEIPGSETAQHILAVAEALLAEHGLNVSMREIGRAADVSIGTINYHFKTRNDLLYCITAGGESRLNTERYQLLDAAEEKHSPPLLEDIIRAFYLPGLKAMISDDLKLVNYMRFLGRLVQDPDFELQQIVDRCFGNLHKRFVFAFSRALPALTLEDVYWRYTAFTGIFVAMTQNPNRINRISHGEVEIREPDRAMQKLLPILLAMMQG